ncbi:MAG: proline--tRNA ligase, partial [Desulfurococcales archaeon]|nr:proline--tRNA ligase [Desulfurococcales archaeon]
MVYSDRAEFNKLAEEAGIIFVGYPVGGVYPYLPSGARMFRRLQRLLEELLEGTGHEPILFPSLIPLTLFRREVDFFEGFSPEALLAEKTLSGRMLDEPLVLRPTSEVPIYYVFSQLIKSWRDLPLKVYQNVTVYRIETKATAPFFRLREVTGFSEEHAFARDEGEAREIFEGAIGIYSSFLDRLGIPYLIVESPPWDLFPGARRN